MKLKPMRCHRQLGLSLVELLVALAIGMTVMSGVVQVLVVSKSNFIAERELASLQENARFALRFLSDEIRMAGFNGCSSTPLNYANSVNGSAGSWYLDGTGLQGFEHEAGNLSFPSEFRTAVLSNTDAIVIRRGERATGLSVSGSHNFNSANLPLNKNHAYKPGQIMVIATPDCQQVGVFQISGPTNNNNNADNMVHNTGSATPGNCTKFLGGNFTCASAGSAVGVSYPNGSSVMELSSQALFVGQSTVGGGIPALFRQILALSGSSAATTREELVQGVELMQILYGLDTTDNGVANLYVKANHASMNWKRVVSVRLFLRMRSINPVYNSNETYPAFMGISGTGGSDRFMRQIVTTTIQIRNG